MNVLVESADSLQTDQIVPYKRKTRRDRHGPPEPHKALRRRELRLIGGFDTVGDIGVDSI